MTRDDSIASKFSIDDSDSLEILGEKSNGERLSLAFVALSATGWAFALRIFERLINVSRVAVMAYFLKPADFGLFGIALIALSILEFLSQTGLQDALIQRKSLSKEHLNTAWTAHIIRGVMLASILAAVAPFLAAFFNEPATTNIIQVISIVYLIRGLENIGVALMMRELDYRTEFRLRASGTIINFLVSLVGVLLLKNVWALVWASIAAALAQTVLSYVFLPYRPVMEFSRKIFGELFSFGKWVMARNIFRFINNYGDDIVVSKILGVTSLGLYQFAYRVSDQLIQEVFSISAKVSFPLMSKIQMDQCRIRRTCGELLVVSLPVSLFIALFIFMLSPDAVRLYLGADWSQMIPALRILALAGIFKAAGPAIAPVIKALGRVDINAKLSLVQFICMMTGIFPLIIAFGLEGAAAAVLLPAMVSLPLLYIAAHRIIGLSARSLLRIVSPSLSSMILAAAGMSGLKWLLGHEFLSFGQLLLTAGVGFFVYSVMLFMWHLLVPDLSCYNVIRKRLFNNAKRNILGNHGISEPG